MSAHQSQCLLQSPYTFSRRSCVLPPLSSSLHTIFTDAPPPDTRTPIATPITAAILFFSTKAPPPCPMKFHHRYPLPGTLGMLQSDWSIQKKAESKKKGNGVNKNLKYHLIEIDRGFLALIAYLLTFNKSLYIPTKKSQTKIWIIVRTFSYLAKS